MTGLRSAYLKSKKVAYTMTALAKLGGILVAILAPVTALAGELSVTDAWFRLILPARPAAGYFELTNGSDQEVVLTGLRTYGCGMAMLHRTVSENGQDRMEMVQKVSVAPGESLSFAPGGYHIMCIMPQSRMVLGAEVPVMLVFADGREVEVAFEVRGPTGE